MIRVKKIYFGLMLVSIFLVSTMCFSYAFFTSKTEGNGKLNIVAGTLNYKIESEDLENNQITVETNTIKEIEIELTSLNDIDSKYELYYTLDENNDNVRVGYDIDTKDSVLGTIDTNSTKTITIILRNESSSSATVTFGVVGGLKNNELALKEGNSLNQIVGKYTAYDIGEEITLTDGSKWHVLEASSETEENIVLLSDYNLNSDGTYNDSCQGIVGDEDSYRCSTIAFDPDLTTNYNEEDSNNVGYFIKNTYIPKVIQVLPNTTNITLPTAYQIAAADNQTFNQLRVNLTTSWLFSTNYWTRNNYEAVGGVWGINGTSVDINYHNPTNANHFGIRPTITTPKSNIVETMSSNDELTIGTSVEAVDGSKWHVLEDSSSDSKYVTLLSDYNLNTDGTYNTECGADINSIYKCSTMAFDSDDTNTYDETDSNNIGYFVKNTYAPSVTKTLLEVTNITLPTAEQIAIADGKSFNQEYLGLTSSWLLTTNYWTKISHSSIVNRAWYVGGEFSLLDYGATGTSSGVGARPVITTLKTNLKAQ